MKTQIVGADSETDLMIMMDEVSALLNEVNHPRDSAKSVSN